ncbi:MAG: helix-turn-helix domain-containing protein [Nitrososphaerales archaeon]
MITQWYEPYHIVIEVDNKRCKVMEILTSLGIEQFKIDDIRGFSGGSIRHLIELPFEQIDKLPKKFPIRAKYSKIGNRKLIWFESEGCDLCNTIISHGAFLISGGSTKDSSLIYSFISPNFDAFKDIISALESSFKLKILKVEKYEIRRKILTEKQEMILWLALKTGFFEYPKRINTIELSRKLGIRPSTLSEIIRRGLQRLLQQYFKTQ